jgi:hypothetical protein
MAGGGAAGRTISRAGAAGMACGAGGGLCITSRGGTGGLSGRRTGTSWRDGGAGMAPGTVTSVRAGACGAAGIMAAGAAGGRMAPWLRRPSVGRPSASPLRPGGGGTYGVVLRACGTAAGACGTTPRGTWGAGLTAAGGGGGGCTVVVFCATSCCAMRGSTVPATWATGWRRFSTSEGTTVTPPGTPRLVYITGPRGGWPGR